MKSSKPSSNTRKKLPIMNSQFVLGLDYGTNSVRALLVDAATGAELADATWNYSHGTDGVILGRDPNLARQNPADYLTGAEKTIREVLVIAGQKTLISRPRKSSVSAWIQRVRRHCRLTSTANHWRFKANSPTIPMRWRGCGKTTFPLPKRQKSPNWRSKCGPNIWPSAAALIQANGISPRFCTV